MSKAKPKVKAAGSQAHAKGKNKRLMPQCKLGSKQLRPSSKEPSPERSSGKGQTTHGGSSSSSSSSGNKQPAPPAPWHQKPNQVLFV